MGTGELQADAGAAESVDRLAIETIGGFALAEQGADTGFDPQRPVAGCHPRPLGQPFECGPEGRDVAGPGRRFGQSARERFVPHWVALECSPGGVARGVVTTEAVVEHGARVGRGDDPQTARGCLLQGGLDQRRRQRLLAAPGHEHHLVVGNLRVPGRLCDEALFFNHQRRRALVSRRQGGSRRGG